MAEIFKSVRMVGLTVMAILTLIHAMREEDRHQRQYGTIMTMLMLIMAGI